MNKITLWIMFLMTCAIVDIQAQENEIILSQSVDQIFISGGISCSGDNSWYRDYVLSEEGVVNDVEIVGIQFGLEHIIAEEELHIYAYDYANFPLNFTQGTTQIPIATGKITVGVSDIGKMIRANFITPISVSAGASIVVQIEQRVGTQNDIFLAVTEKETKTSFLSSSDCGIDDPTPLATLGFPNARHLINLIVVEQTLSSKDQILQSVTVFPNPFSDNLTFRVPASIKVLHLEMLDVLGKSIPISYDNYTVNTSNLTSGFYFLKAITTHGEFIKKIIKH